MNMNRREFVKAGAGVFFIASSSRLFGAGAPSSRVRFAIVGCRERGRGRDVLENALSVPGTECVCVCDVDSRAMDFAAEFVRSRTGRVPRKEKDFRKVLEMSDVDAVVSETPDHFHAYSAVMAMRAGKHVYVEKPCAFCPGECEVILETWKRTGKVFQMGSQRRATPNFIEAIAAVRGGSLVGRPRYAKCWYMTKRGPIGKGKSVPVPEWLDWDLWQGPAPREGFRDNLVPYNWHWFRKWGTGEAGNNSVHFVDVARWCLGVEEYPSLVSSAGGRFWIPDGTDWEWPDTQNISWTYRGGQAINWEGLSCATQNPYLGLSTGAEIYCEGGAVLFKPNSGVDVFDEKGKTIRSWSAPEETKAVVDTNNRAGGVGAKGLTILHFDNFVQSIRDNTPGRAYANAEIATLSTSMALTGNIAQLTGETLRLDVRTGRPIGSSAADALWRREYERGWEI